MSKERYQWYMGTSEIIDNKTKKFITQDCPELLNKQLKQISDLEAKLAESEENNKLLEMQLQDMERSKLSWENQYFTLYNTLKNYREVTEKKLAEKEKEIEYLTKQAKKFNNEAQKYFEDAYCNDSIYQDKILFAVEQLTLFKNTIVNKMNNPYNLNIKHILSDFDNQIKQLKEMK